MKLLVQRLLSGEAQPAEPNVIEGEFSRGQSLDVEVGCYRANLVLELCRLLGEEAVAIHFLDAVGLAALLQDGHDFKVPMEVVGDGVPVGSDFADIRLRIRRRVQHHVVRWGDLRDPAQRAAQQCGGRN